MGIVLLFTSLFAWSVTAGIIKENARNFTTVGSMDYFIWAPEHNPSRFKYEVFYYIPESLKTMEGARALIFLHGGGGSTRNRVGSLNVASDYMVNDLQKWANALKMVVIAPSAAGLNWGGHTFTMLRELIRVARMEMAIDPNNIGLAGHSMGGMGITRNYLWLADEFAYFVPMAAGLDPVFLTEQHLNKVFNVPYVHLQGKQDHFTEFITRCDQQANFVTELASTTQRTSLFELIYYEGRHNLDYWLSQQTFERLQQKPRNIYQPILYGSLFSTAEELTENNITFKQKSVDRYFWVKIKEADNSAPERLDFQASILNNVIELNLVQKPEKIKSLELLLSQKLLDFSLPVIIKVNGQIIQQYLPQVQKDLVVDPTDETYLFEDTVVIKI